MGFGTSNGKMLRLPLRYESMARDSELSDQTVTLETIDRLLARSRPDNYVRLPAVSKLLSMNLAERD
jgi:hypothetical protein